MTNGSHCVTKTIRENHKSEPKSHKQNKHEMSEREMIANGFCAVHKSKSGKGKKRKSHERGSTAVRQCERIP